jgi:hypothetical protein
MYDIDLQFTSFETFHYYFNLLRIHMFKWTLFVTGSLLGIYKTVLMIIILKL